MCIRDSYLIEQGVTTAADIDRAVKYAVGMRYASIGLLEYFDAVGYELESAIAKNVYPDLCGTRELQQLVLDGLATGKTGQAAGQGLYDWSQTVSYTHLDVYKRQSLRCSAPAFSAT